MEFFMAMEPPTVTHQEKKVAVRNGKPIFYEPAHLKLARAKLMGHLAEFAPKEKFEGPVQIVVKWCFPKIKGKLNGQWKDTKPDTDNLNKLLKDCMTDLHFWKDDAQVASEICEKFWSDVPGIYIKIISL